jgi:hypothetical protein
MSGTAPVAIAAAAEFVGQHGERIDRSPPTWN